MGGGGPVTARSTRNALTKALHQHVCGTEWDEWNQPCVWAGEDWDPENGPATCAYVDEIGVEDAVLAWVGTLADDETLVDDLNSRAGWTYGTRDALETLAAALTERGDQS